MSNSGVNVFSKQARFHDLAPVPSNRGDLQRWPIIKDFLSIVDFHAGNLAQVWCQRFLETGEVSGHGSNSVEQRGPVRVANHAGCSFYR